MVITNPNYKIECPYCKAPIGRPCYQVSNFKRRGQKKPLYPPHRGRVKGGDKSEDEGRG